MTIRIEVFYYTTRDIPKREEERLGFFESYDDHYMDRVDSGAVISLGGSEDERSANVEVAAYHLEGGGLLPATWVQRTDRDSTLPPLIPAMKT